MNVSTGLPSPMDEAAPLKSRLICGMISADPVWFDKAVDILMQRFGPIDITSDTFDFDFTDYYNDETGSPLFRKFIAFATPVSPDDLADIKRQTNEIERDFSACSASKYPRPINIDPGYVTPSKLVLASMKDFSHRICLDHGVYAEVTMLYNRGWQTLPWTFPDYGSGRYFAFLDSCRENLLQGM